MITNPTVRRYTALNAGLSPATFVPLMVPVDCSGYMLKNAGPDTIFMRSDPSDAETEDSMGAGFYEDLLIAGTGPYERRFIAGQILYYVKCTGPLVGKFYY